MKPCLMLWLFLSTTVFAQQRVLVSPNDEVIPLKRNTSAIQTVRGQRHTTENSSACGTRFTFGYPEGKFPPNSNFGARHKDVMGEWFIAPAGGTIDTIFWEILGSVASLDSMVSVRIFRSNIYSGKGPGYGPYSAPCSPWGYYHNANDLDQGITPFIDEATDTTWVSTLQSDSTSFDPLGQEIWQSSAHDFQIHAGKVNFAPLSEVGDTLKIMKGDPFFVTMRMNSINNHVSEYDRTEFAAYGFRVNMDNENYPSRNWKFYEHDSGPSNCSGHNSNNIPRGWVARGGFGDDSLDVAIWNVWYSMTVTSNVPPNVRSTTQQPSTFGAGPYPIEAEIDDCDPADPPGGVTSAVILWSIDDVIQTPIAMSNVGGTYWDAELPAQDCGHQITYRVEAADNKGEVGAGAQYTFSVACFGSDIYYIDTGATCPNREISSTGITIPNDAFFLPHTAPTTTIATDNGTAGPFDIGGVLKFFGDTVRYAWIGIDGAMALSKNAMDTLDINSNGQFTSSWSFPYLNRLRARRDVGSIVMERMPTHFISPFWNDNILADTVGDQFGHIRYQRYVGGDTCLFVVEWDTISTYMLAGSIPDETKYRVVLNRCDGTIEFQYDNTGRLGLDTTALVGMQGHTNAEYVFIYDNGPLVTKPRNNWCIKFYPHVSVSAEDEREMIPGAFALFQNYPNPFNPTTSFGFRIAKFGFVSLKVFDVIGREMATLVQENKQPGEYTVSWDAAKIPSGIYFCQLSSGAFFDVKKVVLLK